MKPKPINEVRHLRLIPSDFDSLTESCSSQYLNPCGCPVYRCLKRSGYPDVMVGGTHFDSGNDRRFTDSIEEDNIESARLKLLGGAKYAVIKL